MTMILRRPTEKDENIFLQAIKQYPLFLEYDNNLPFSHFLNTIRNREKGIDLPVNFVPVSILAGFVGNAIVGRLSIRHKLTPLLQEFGGHIGYGVIPEYRRKGYATEMLKQALPICKELGIKQVMLTCDIDNIGSYKAMEKNGAYLYDVIKDNERNRLSRKYLIDL